MKINAANDMYAYALEQVKKRQDVTQKIPSIEPASMNETLEKLEEKIEKLEKKLLALRSRQADEESIKALEIQLQTLMAQKLALEASMFNMMA